MHYHTDKLEQTAAFSCYTTCEALAETRNCSVCPSREFHYFINCMLTCLNTHARAREHTHTHTHSMWTNVYNRSCIHCKRERERNVLFNDALNTFYLRLYGVRYMVKDHYYSEKGNPLSPHRLLLSINSKGSFICTIP